MSISTSDDVVGRLRPGRSLPGRWSALTTSMPWRSSRLVSAKMLRTSSSTTSTLRPCSGSSLWCRRLDHLLLGRRQVGDHAMQEQRGLVEQALGRSHALEHDALGLLAQLALPRRRVSSRPVNTTIGTSRSCGSCWISVEQLEAATCPAGAGRARRSRSGRSRMRCERLGAGADAW